MKTKFALVLTAAVVFGAASAMADNRQTSQGDQAGGANSGSKGGSSQSDTGDSSDQSSSTSGPTIKDLLTAGYEIKTVTLIPHDVVKRADPTTDVDAVVFVLQKGAAAATCYVAFTAYTNGDFYTLSCVEGK